MGKIIACLIAAATFLIPPSNAIAGTGEIAVIAKGVHTHFWASVRHGAEKASTTMPGYSLSFAGPASETNNDEQIRLVEAAIKRNVAGIVLAPSNPEALVPPIKLAWEHSIPVVVIDSAISSMADAYYQAFLGTDNIMAGRTCAAEMIKRMGTTGKLAVMSYVVGAGSEIDRVGGFLDYIRSHSSIEIIGPFYSQSQTAAAMNQALDVLAANPGLTGMFAANEPTSVGMARAIAQEKLAGRIVAVGFDGNPELMGFVRQDVLQGIAVQESFHMGEASIETMGRILAGKPVKRTVDTGIVFVTKDNVDDPGVERLIE